jgi:hypothetical protein
MPAMHTYPVLTIAETYIRQSIYDALPENVRATMSFEDFRTVMTSEDYRYFSAALSDLINDYVVENDLFSEFVGNAVQDTISRSETLAKLFMARDISRRGKEDDESPLLQR